MSSSSGGPTNYGSSSSGHDEEQLLINFAEFGNPPPNWNSLNLQQKVEYAKQHKIISPKDRRYVLAALREEKLALNARAEQDAERLQREAEAQAEAIEQALQAGNTKLAEELAKEYEFFPGRPAADILRQTAEEAEAIREEDRYQYLKSINAQPQPTPPLPAYAPSTTDNTVKRHKSSSIQPPAATTTTTTDTSPMSAAIQRQIAENQQHAQRLAQPANAKQNRRKQSPITTTTTTSTAPSPMTIALQQQLKADEELARRLHDEDRRLRNKTQRIQPIMNEAAGRGSYYPQATTSSSASAAAQSESIKVGDYLEIDWDHVPYHGTVLRIDPHPRKPHKEIMLVYYDEDQSWAEHDLPMRSSTWRPSAVPLRMIGTTEQLEDTVEKNPGLYTVTYTAHGNTVTFEPAPPLTSNSSTPGSDGGMSR